MSEATERLPKEQYAAKGGGIEQTTRLDRESFSRDESWEPPEQLRTPEPPEGWKYRWVRYEIRGTPDNRNVLSRLRQHYQLVTTDEIPDTGDFESFQVGQYAGIIMSGDLLLMKVPIHIAEQRQDFYHKKARRMQKAVDQEFDQEDTDLMPVTRKTRTVVETGRPKFQDDSDDE